MTAWSTSSGVASGTDDDLHDALLGRPGAISRGEAERRAQSLVEAHWGRIEQVAAELAADGSSGGQV